MLSNDDQNETLRPVTVLLIWGVSAAFLYLAPFTHCASDYSLVYRQICNCVYDCRSSFIQFIDPDIIREIVSAQNMRRNASTRSQIRTLVNQYTFPSGCLNRLAFAINIWGSFYWTQGAIHRAQLTGARIVRNSHWTWTQVADPARVCLQFSTSHAMVLFRSTSDYQWWVRSISLDQINSNQKQNK